MAFASKKKGYGGQGRAEALAAAPATPLDAVEADARPSLRDVAKTIAGHVHNSHLASQKDLVRAEDLMSMAVDSLAEAGAAVDMRRRASGEDHEGSPVRAAKPRRASVTAPRPRP